MRNRDFIDLVKDVKHIKYQYKKIVGKKENDILINQIKRGIYSIDIIEWKKDWVWKYLNDEIPYSQLLEDLKLDRYGRPIRK